MQKVEMENVQEYWAFEANQYVQEYVQNVEYYLKKQDKIPPSPKIRAPLTKYYRPEMDISEELSESETSYYQLLIGVMRWIVELKTADICVELSMMYLLITA